MFEYFDIETINGDEVLDVWKSFSLEFASEDYEFHSLLDGDNLMSISYRYYNTIDNWWILYLFNEMNNINFDLIDSTTIRNTIEKHQKYINNYSNLLNSRKKYISESVRNYFISEEFSFKESIIKTNDFLSSVDDETLFEYGVYLEKLLISDSYYNTSLKIPSIDVIQDIKNQLEDLSDIWKS